MLPKSFLLFMSLALSIAAHAAAPVHVNISAVDGIQQTVSINQRLPRLLVARATFDNGAPVVGLKLQFGVNACMSGLGTTGSSACPDPTVYGHFLGATVATTDAQGNAVSSAFVAGSAPGSYNLFVSRADWSQIIGGQTLTDIPFAPTVSNIFHVVQAPAPATDPAPALSLPASAVLIALLGLAALRRVRV